MCSVLFIVFDIIVSVQGCKFLTCLQLDEDGNTSHSKTAVPPCTYFLPHTTTITIHNHDRSN